LGVFLLAAPSIAVAQRATVVRRIGALEMNEPDRPEFLWKQAEPLRRLGWVEGQNLQVERRYANNRLEALQPLAEELVSARVELIVTGGTPATLAAKRATNTIPIVIRTAGDPVLLGLVASLARPGGNVTGYSQVGPELDAKSLSLLRELVPALQRIGVLELSAHPYYRAQRGQFELICRSLHLDPVFGAIATPDEIGDAVAQLARKRVQALMLRGGEFYDYRFEIAAAAVKHGLPTLSIDSDLVREADILVAYSATQAEQDQQRARYIDLILRGAKPADLPVQQPTKFELVINLKTARALGLTIPQALLLRADEVIK
jgi:putative ABC transport system substrate-binding protein